MTNNLAESELPFSEVSGPPPLEHTQSHRVRILSDRVANQIAAGEVVERPASVVKELVENSIDAGATEITLLIANGGKTAITVIDNGHGMNREDALLAIERFGTSKVREVTDLDEISSLGFRGEALPSIASVSRFWLQTSTRDAENDGSKGVEIFIEGGKLREVRPSSRKPGTTIEVKNLFFNVPARKKFLRSEVTEKGLIKSTFIDLTLTRPQVHFRLVSDGVEELALAPVQTVFARAADLNLAPKSSLKITSAKGTEAIIAMLSPPAESVPSSAKLRLLVNGRAIRDSLLLKAVRDGYGNFLKGGAYPSGFISLRILPQDLDVNVHPRKTEVRFRKSEEVFALVSTSIRQTFSRMNPLDFQQSSFYGSDLNAPTADFMASSAPFFMPHSPVFSVSDSAPAEQLQRPTLQGATGQLPVSFQNARPPSSDSASERFSTLANARFLGQVFNCYLILEATGELFILDMHAAHERVMFYTIKSRLFSGDSLPTQLLLTPQVVEIDEDKLEGLERSLPALQRLGIDCERFGPHSLIVRGIPAMFHRLSPETLLRELTSLPYWDNWEAALLNRLDEVVARLACHGSVRSGRILEREEVYELITKMREVESSGLCPHGRPVLVRISQYEMETMFAR